MEEITIIAEELDVTLVTLEKRYDEHLLQKCFDLSKELELGILDLPKEQQLIWKLWYQSYFTRITSIQSKRQSLFSQKKPIDIETVSPIEMLKVAGQIQKTDLELLREGQLQLEEAKQIGVVTMAQLGDQGDTLDHVAIDLGKIEDNTTRSKKQLVKLGRGVAGTQGVPGRTSPTASDKIVWCLVLLFLIAIILCIVLPITLHTVATNSTVI